MIAEVTAIASLLNLVSKTPLWATSAITLIICLLYILRGGFKLSVITDKYQFIIVSVIILASFTLILESLDISSFEIIKKNSPNLLDTKYLPNYTAGLTFFIAVAATNLFHQGNWQRVFAARDNNKLKNSLLFSSLIIFLIVFWMGYTGLISYSLNQEVNPDLAFFDIFLKNKDLYIILGILILALSLTLSTIDTLINAISSILILNGKQINKGLSGKELKKKVNFIILLLSLIVFLISSKGYSILYLFLLADLLCCAAVITIFYGFFKKKIEFKLARLSILLGLICGFLFFPSIDFQKSLLVGIILPSDLFSNLITNNLLFISFTISILIQFFVIFYYSFRNSFR